MATEIAAQAAHHDFLDLNGRQVHAFALEMQNLGFSRMTEKLLAMLESGSWQSFRDGLGQWQFLPCEFDYFLSSQGVKRDEVINGVKDMDAKAKLDEVMDERTTGKETRRPVLDVRAANPTRAGREIEPFGLTSREAKAMIGESKHRAALGPSVRQWRKTGGQTTRAPGAQRPLVERLYIRARRLSPSELEELIDKLADLREQGQIA